MPIFRRFLVSSIGCTALHEIIFYRVISTRFVTLLLVQVQLQNVLTSLHEITSLAVMPSHVEVTASTVLQD